VPTATIVVDGEIGDWAALPESADPGCGGCAAGDVTRVRGARISDGRVAFLLETSGAPRVDATNGYSIWLQPIAGPLFAINLIIDGPFGLTAWLNYLELQGLPVTHAVGPAGLEIAIPIAAWPFGGGLELFGERAVLGSDGWESPQSAFPPFARVCWDPASTVCRGN
jgi:hypothetical protein